MTIGEHKADVFAALENHLRRSAARAIAERGVFHMALSGGSTPAPFYRRLAEAEAAAVPSWQQTHVWLVDERAVPLEDERSNWRMISQALVERVEIATENAHPIPVSAADPTREYERDLSRAFKTSLNEPPPRIDFVLLGMGSDCHTASLFPDSPALSASDRWVAANDGPAVTPPPRYTMTFPLLNRAREVAVLVCGSGKAESLRRVAEHAADDVSRIPILGIDPTTTGGTLDWYLDRPAATHVAAT